MTEDSDYLPPALQLTLDVLIAVTMLGLAAVAIGYEAVTALTAVAREHVETDMRVADWVGVGGMVLMAPYAYLLEWADRHNRIRAQFWRKMGWSFQTVLLVLCVATTADQHKYRLIPIAISTVVTGAGAWAYWMRTQLLPPDDQLVIDKLIVEQELAQTRAVRALGQQRREARLQRLAARYQTPGATTANVPEARNAGPAWPWPIPEGKHQPAVYFVRNGDRVKIGTSTNVRNRMSSLSLRTEDIAVLLTGGRYAEQAFHKQFAEQRVGNTEWFHCTGPLAAYIAERIAIAWAEYKAKG